MISRRISLGYLVAVSVVVLVILIGIVTYIAWRVINRTVLEQFQATELQLITSLSQQTQVSISSLGSNISGLAVKEEIRATSSTRQDQALELLAQEARNFPDGVIISITRFDFRGDPRYAFPSELNSEIETLQDRSGYVYAIPDELVEMTRRGQRVTDQIEIKFYSVRHRDTGQQTLLLIAPVDSVGLDTEFIAYELNLEPLFANLFSFVSLGDTGQLWVLNRASDIMYQARPTPGLETTYRDYSRTFLTSLSDPVIDTYLDKGVSRQAAIGTAPALNDTFVIFISRAESETQKGVTNNVIGIFSFSVVAMLAVVGLGSAAGRQISRINQARQIEAQRQQTGRILLEVSRALNSSLDLPTVLQRILAELQQLVPHDSASVLLMEEEGLRVAANRGSEIELEVLQLSEARAARQVIETGNPIVINNTSADPRWTHVQGTEIVSWIGLPLRVRDELVGVLNVNSKTLDHFRKEDIELAEAFADQASVALQNARLHDLEVKQLDQELAIARGIQTSLLPSASPEMPQIEVAANSLPASQVSGDFYQYFPLPDGRLGIAIGDVQGKGIPAALMMAVITTAMRDEVIRHQNPANVLQSLNTRLLERMQRNHMNSALVMVTFNPRNYEVEIANGGMVQPYVRPKDGQKFEFVPVSGYPLGVSASMKYTAKTISLEPGSLMVIFSDGVLEARNAGGEFFGFDRIETLLDALPQDVDTQVIVDRILHAVRDHLGGIAPQDDTTILAIRALEVPVEAHKLKPQNGDADDEFLPTPIRNLSLGGETVPTVMTSVDVSPERKNVELYLPSKLGFEKVARSTAGALAREIGFNEEKVEDIQTAVAESCMNAIEHGNAEDLAEPVKVLLSASTTGIEIRVTDSGRKRLSPDMPEPGIGDMRGWGLFFIKNLMDIFEVKHLPQGGNQVLMVCYLQPESKNNGSYSEVSATKLGNIEVKNIVQSSTDINT